MSRILVPGQQAPQQVTFDLAVNGEAIVIRLNGLTLPPLTAEAILDLANKLGQAANHVIANRVPVEQPNGAALPFGG